LYSLIKLCIIFVVAFSVRHILIFIFSVSGVILDSSIREDDDEKIELKDILDHN